VRGNRADVIIAVKVISSVRSNWLFPVHRALMSRIRCFWIKAQGEEEGEQGKGEGGGFEEGRQILPNCSIQKSK